MSEIQRYLSAEKIKTDDFGVAFSMLPGEFVYDAKTVSGPWACMTRESYEKHAHTRMLGIGLGQMYCRDQKGRLLLIGGDE